jgi:hypothetical protein
MPSIHSSVRTAERRHSQPHAEVLTDQSLHGDFHARLPHVFTGVVSCLNINAIARYKNFAIHLLPEDRSFLAQKDRKKFRETSLELRQNHQWFSIFWDLFVLTTRHLMNTNESANIINRMSK